MKIINLDTSVKWQKSDKRDVSDMREKILSDILFPKGLILEIGCAAGNFFDLLCKKKLDDNHYVGVDIDSQQINKARNKFPGANFIHGDALNSKFDETIKSASVIVSFQVLEHITMDIDLIKKIEIGTFVVFSVPNFTYRSASVDGHKRWFELDGWVDRYKDVLNISEAWSIKHYKKDRKIFVFQSTRR